MINENREASEKKNPLFEKMQNAQFFMIKAPNHEFLLKGVLNSEWCFTGKALTKIRETQI